MPPVQRALFFCLRVVSVAGGLRADGKGHTRLWLSSPASSTGATRRRGELPAFVPRFGEARVSAAAG
jgi:hypothetical protein